MPLRKLRLLIVIMSLMIFLSSSSFFLYEHLSSQINNNKYTNSQFTYALKKGYKVALLKEVKKASYGSDYWLITHQELAKTVNSSAFKLGWWNQELATITSNKKYINVAIMWFKQAIRLRSQEAIVALAQLYFNLGEVVQAKETLGLLSSLSVVNKSQIDGLILQVKVAIYLGDINRAKLLVKSKQFKAINSQNMGSLVTDIQKFNVLGDTPVISTTQSKPLSTSCTSSVQLFATNISHLKHLELLIDTFQSQHVLAPFICLPTPKYISKQVVGCLAEKKHAISCNEAHWRAVTKQVNTRHVGLMLGEGGANVHLGILYFDHNDNVEVFSHELSHLLGFVDEYPLVKGHVKCQGPQRKSFSHNVAVLNKYYQGERQKIRSKILANVAWASLIKESTPILQQDFNGNSDNKTWLLGTPISYQAQVGVYIAESCNKVGQNNSLLMEIPSAPLYAAFKPLNRRTQLKYFANTFPDEYLTLLKENPKVYQMPSFHYNIALALYNQGKVKEAKYWLIKAAQWEKTPLRKSIILQGDF
jgi:hypothetical protein